MATGTLELAGIVMFSPDGARSSSIVLDTDNAVKFSGGMKFTGNLTVSGDIVSNSDERLKSNIRPIENSLDIIKQLNGKRYIKDERESIGLIAQEVEKILPEMVLTSNDEGNIKSVNYQNIIAILIEAIKEQQKQIDSLQTR